MMMSSWNVFMKKQRWKKKKNENGEKEMVEVSPAVDKVKNQQTSGFSE